MKRYSNVLSDVVTAFLHGEFQDGKEIYMECPLGLKAEEGMVLILTKTIYGLVQAARAFYKKLSNVLKWIRFEASLADMFDDKEMQNWRGIYWSIC